MKQQLMQMSYVHIAFVLLFIVFVVIAIYFVVKKRQCAVAPSCTSAPKCASCLPCSPLAQHTKIGSDWTCAIDSLPPLRVNKGGDIECASPDGTNCMWPTPGLKCSDELAKLPANVKPAVCTADEYAIQGSWCNQGKNLSLQ